MEENNIITLTDEQGTQVNFELLDLIPYEGKEYAVLYPEDDDGEAQGVTILSCEPEENTDDVSFLAIEDDDVLQIIFDLFKERAKDRFNFVD